MSENSSKSPHSDTAVTFVPDATSTDAAAPQNPEQAIAAERTAIAAAQRQGQLDPSAAADLDHHLDEISRALQHPNPHQATHKVSDLRRRLDDLVHAGRLTSASLTRISSPLDQLAALLASTYGPPSEGNGDNG